MKFAVYFLFFIFYFFNTLSLEAQTFIGPVAEGSGGSGVASADIAESFFLNPASVVHASGLFSGFYFTRGAGERIFALSLVDNHEDTLIPGGASYLRVKKNQNGKVIGEDRIELAFGNFIYKQLALGTSLKWSRQEFLQKKYNQWNLNLGLHWNPLHYLGLGLVYYNPIKASKKLPEDLRWKPTWAAGVVYLPYDFLRLRLDLNEGFPRIGFESSINRGVMVRLGYAKLSKNSSQGSLGFSLLTPLFKIDFSVSQQLNDLREKKYILGLRIP